MNAHGTAARLNVAHQSYALGVGVEHDIVGVGKDQSIIFLQVAVGENGRVIRCVHSETVLFSQRLDRFNRIGDVVVDVALSVFCADQHPYFPPIKLLRTCVGGPPWPPLPDMQISSFGGRGGHGGPPVQGANETDRNKQRGRTFQHISSHRSHFLMPIFCACFCAFSASSVARKQCSCVIAVSVRSTMSLTSCSP